MKRTFRHISGIYYYLFSFWIPNYNSRSHDVVVVLYRIFPLGGCCLFKLFVNLIKYIYFGMSMYNMFVFFNETQWPDRKCNDLTKIIFIILNWFSSMKTRFRTLFGTLNHCFSGEEISNLSILNLEKWLTWID